MSHDSDRQLKLNLPFNKEDAIIDLYYPQGKGKNLLWIYFKEQNRPSHVYESSWLQPYLIIPAGDVKPSELDAQMLINAIRSQFKAGIQFSNKLVRNAQICQFVVEALNRSRPQGYVLNNLDLTC